MIKCPICSTQYYELPPSSCTTCGFNLSSYPEKLGEIPSTMVKKQLNEVDGVRTVQVKLDDTQTKVNNFNFEADGDKIKTIQELLANQQEIFETERQKQNQDIATLQKNLEKAYQAIYQLANNIQVLAQRVVALENGTSLAPPGQGVAAPNKNFKIKLDNNIEIEMVYIKAGDVPITKSNQQIWTTAHVEEFYIAKHPITQIQYHKIMGENPSDFVGNDNPVECISWDEAQEFCSRLSKLTKKQFLLPSEKQWEYAARAGNKGKWCFGNDEKLLTEYAWYQANSERKTHPVGQKKPNRWGLHDMHGNVWEWCQNEFRDRNQKLQDDRIKYIALRGGSWFIGSFYCGSADRTRATYDSLSGDVGFRIVCAVK